jgi:peptide/nickel transport system substrate-binding protein
MAGSTHRAPIRRSTFGTQEREEGDVADKQAQFTPSESNLARDNDPRVRRLLADARAGRLSRRQVLSAGLRLGLASPAILGLMAAAPNVAAGPAPVSPRRLLRTQEGSGALTIIIGGWPPNLDPHYAYDNLASMLFLGTYEMLIQYKGESTDEYEPMLAESWEANEDGSTYTFKLAPNALFHNGDPCDAAAVKAAFERFLLQGAGPVNVISRFVETPEQIVVVDPTTIRFDLGRPQPLFLPAMAAEYGPFVVNTRFVEEHKTDDDPWAHEWFRENMIGTGPYQQQELMPDERVVLTRFEDYHRGWTGTEFAEIVVRIVPENATRRQLLERGEADASTFDLTPDDVEAMKSNPDLQVLTYPSTAVGWTIMNAPRLKTADARKGFSYAFPYDEVVNGAYKGLLKRTGPLPTTVRGYDPNVFVYQTDLVKAKELILAGGFAEGDSFEYIFPSDNELDRTVAQLFQAKVAEIGFELVLTEVDNATRDEIVYGDSPAEERPHFVGGWAWWPDYNDPWNQLAPNFLESATGGGGSNGGYWVNQRFEEIMAEAEHYTDEARLQELMVEAQNILTEQDPPCIYLGEEVYFTILGKDIQGFYANPLYLGSYPFYKMSRAAQ